MPFVINKIEGQFLDNHTSYTPIINTLSTIIQTGDYIKTSGYVAFLQNYTHVDKLTHEDNPLTFGLKKKYKLQPTVLQLSY